MKTGIFAVTCLVAVAYGDESSAENFASDGLYMNDAGDMRTMDH
eukprot:CAMPEP_0176370606 /NCGR_PEP_ID=MMETSP0126-20121128/24112_1 /TAXON_ID=141414 ORGANISM="Strombidinopsis acuminatum, Strain SPMC142" /NCGR_SAMPLE_ID=MMETSP0126 /ASSEMBLY_ACC=CAM_ASM_000229 /LENGTH=43 /DNA_ID= /DNA_START= /DNA_END= /DNA_ORIENTATION=